MLEWLEAHMGACVFMKYLHVECPGCGIQRAFIALLRGNVLESIRLFPALLPYLTTLCMLVWQIYSSTSKKAMLIMFLFLVSTGIMLVSYILKLTA
jgi:hypothetical protein